MIGGWAYFLYMLGPANALIQADLNLSDTRAGLLSTLVSVGGMTAGLLAPRLVAQFGRRSVLLAGAAVMALGALTMGLAGNYAVLVVGLLLGGLAGVGLANTSTAVMSDHRPGHKAEAITEANALAAWIGVLAPLTLGVAVAVGAGWRGGFWIAAVLPLLLIWPILRLVPDLGRQPARGTDPLVPSAADGDPQSNAADASRLPASFWWATAMLAAGGAVEFCINYWGASLIALNTGSALAAAASAMAAVVLGVAVGRVIGARLARVIAVPNLAVAAFLLALVGIGGLMLAPGLAAAVAALLLAGLGISVLYPFGQAMAVHAAGGRSDRAVGVAGVVLSLSIGIAPFAIGVAADQFGVRSAFWLVPALAVVGLFCAARLTRLPDADPSQPTPVV